MHLLFLSYSNSQNSPLLSLSEEDDQLYKMLARREAKLHFRIHRDSFTTISKTSEYLILFQDDISLFHYSGHADRDQLLLDDISANASGIAQLLGRCKNLKFVLLNGCSTVGQVDQLLEAGVPVVIGTSAPVGDLVATKFAISFYQSLTEKYKSIAEAFQDAMGTAQTYSTNKLEVNLTQRGIDWESIGKESLEPLWGLYYQKESDLEWRLPANTYTLPIDSGYSTNEILIEKLIESLSEYNEDIAKIYEQEKLGIERTAGEKKKAILKCLPHPVSQQLRKLMSKEKGMEEHVFYNKPGVDRLRQIGHIYSTMVELLSYILIADLWQTLEINTNLSLPLAKKNILLAYVKRQQTDNRAPFDFIPLIRSIRQFFEQNDLSFFVKEFPSTSQLFNENTDFTSACRFLEASRKRITKGDVVKEEAFRLSIIAEEKLAVVFSQLGFLAAYSLSSIRGISVLKYRYPHTPMFNHKIIFLEQEFIELEERPEIMNSFMDSASVLVQRKSGNSTEYLNLSPFVIDESAFDDKAELAKLFFFEQHDGAADLIRYRNVYKPNDLPLILKNQRHFKVLRAQFDAFSSTIFQQKLREL